MRAPFVKLPTELSVHIFAESLVPVQQKIKDDDDIVLNYYNELSQLVAVCRRFHDLIYSTATFWTIISNSLRPDIVDAYLDRSKNAKLKISLLYCESGRYDGVSFLRKVIPFCHRWQSFSITYFNSSDEKFLREGFRMLSGLHVDALQCIEWSTPDRGSWSQRPHRLYDGDKYHAYLTWRAPLLRHFTAVGMFPRAVTDRNLHLSFTSCKLQFLISWSVAPKPASALTTFLASQTALERLELDVRHFPIERHFELSGRIVLPSLRTLILEAYDEALEHQRQSVVTFVPTFLRWLEFPVIESMSLTFPFIDRKLDVMATLFPSSNYTTLTHLSLSMFYRGTSHVRLSLFTPIFKRVPNLQYLRVYAEDMSIREADLPTLTVKPPPLQKLHLYYCAGISKGTLLGVVKFLSCGSGWESFQRLRIEGCPQLFSCRITLKTLVPEDKIDVLD